MGWKDARAQASAQQVAAAEAARAVCCCVRTHTRCTSARDSGARCRCRFRSVARAPTPPPGTEYPMVVRPSFVLLPVSCVSCEYESEPVTREVMRRDWLTCTSVSPLSPTCERWCTTGPSVDDLLVERPSNEDTVLSTGLSRYCAASNSASYESYSAVASCPLATCSIDMSAGGIRPEHRRIIDSRPIS